MVAIRTYDMGDTMLTAGAIRKQRMEQELMAPRLATAEADYALQRAGTLNAFVTGALPKVQQGDFRDFYGHLETMGSPKTLGLPSPDSVESMTSDEWKTFKKKEAKKQTLDERGFDEFVENNPGATHLDYLEAKTKATDRPKASMSDAAVSDRLEDLSLLFDRPELKNAEMFSKYNRYKDSMSQTDAYDQVMQENVPLPEGLSRGAVEFALEQNPDAKRLDIIRKYIENKPEVKKEKIGARLAKILDM